MLKFVNSSSLRNYIALYSHTFYAFAASNKRNAVPKIMKDPRYTRQGLFKKRKKSLQYDLTQPHIEFPERYYDEKVDHKLERKLYKERRKERKGFEEITPNNPRPFENILKDLTSDKVLAEGSSRLILNIDELETSYKDKIDNNVKDVIVRALKSLNSRIHLKNLRELGIITSLNRKYGIMDQEIWKNCKFALMKYFIREENETIKLVNHEQNEQNFTHTLNNVLHVARRVNLDVSDLLKAVERNYLEKASSFTNLQSLILFTTALSNIPSLKRGAIWESIDKGVAPHLKEMNILDAVTLVNSFSKAQVRPSFLDQLVMWIVEKFIADFGTVKDRKVEKISIMAHALAGFRQVNEKFNTLAEREVEANLSSVDNVTDCRFIVCSFSRLRIKSKKVFDHCGNQIMQNVNTLTYNNLEQFVQTFLPKNLLPNNFFNVLAKRIDQLLEEDPMSFTKERAETMVRGLEKWKNEAMIQDDELITKMRHQIQYWGN